jgi:hypothetical protein
VGISFFGNGPWNFLSDFWDISPMNLSLAPLSSAWAFETFGSGGLGLGLIAAGGGTVILRAPSGEAHQFYYGGAGVGLSAGLKLPKIGKVQIPIKKSGLTGAVGPTSFPSTGMVLKTINASRPDLTQSDISGLCVFIDVGGGLIAGAGGTCLLFGIPLQYGPLLVVPGIGGQLFMNAARGILLMAGANVGVQAGGGIAGMIGYMGKV